MPTVTAVVRDILKADFSLATDQVMAKAMAKGAKTTPDKMRKIIYKEKAMMRKAGAKPTLAAASARTTPNPTLPAAVPGSVTSAISVSPPAVTTVVNDLSSVLANVALVNRVVGLAGGPENARQLVEAVRACGSVDAFLQHLELVTSIRGGDATVK